MLVIILITIETNTVSCTVTEKQYCTMQVLMEIQNITSSLFKTTKRYYYSNNFATFSQSSVKSN